MARKRFGVKEGLRSLLVPGIFYFCLFSAIFASLLPILHLTNKKAFVVLGVFALWRYGWQLTNVLRAFFYSLYYYPHLRRNAARFANTWPSHIFFVIPSYKEEAWVSVECIQSVLSNLADLPVDATLVIATGCDQDDSLITQVYLAHPAHHKVNVVLQRQKDGKRIAMGNALRAVARRHTDDYNSLTLFMDGDSYLETGTLKRIIPFFAAMPKLGAVTTNEMAYINTRSLLYKDWFNLKFGQRHIQFQSQALSKKVMTLTGRLSVFRTAIVTEEKFIKTIETDSITHWRHGKFRFLMGDDKSSWFCLLQDGWDMLYLPDILCYSLESRDADFYSLSISLPYRWYGNTLRNNARALALGWRRTGFFIWLVIFDQRINMWMSLVGITGALILTIFTSFVYLPFYIAWVLMIRWMQMIAIAVSGHPVSMRTIPLILYNQWVGALVKITSFYHLSDQSWSKGNSSQKVKTDIIVPRSRLAKFMPGISQFRACTVFIFGMLLAHGILIIPLGFGLFPVNAQPALVIAARSYGVIPDDGKDDSGALNNLLGWVANFPGSVIELPEGVIDLHAPVRVAHGQLTIRGKGPDATHVVSSISGTNQAVFQIEGSLRYGSLFLKESLAAGSKTFTASEPGTLEETALILLRMPNTTSFLRMLGARGWQEEFPYLRQQLTTVEQLDQASGRLVLGDAALFDSEMAGDTEIVQVFPVAQFLLENMTIEQLVPGQNIDDARHRYENLHPEFQVDTISVKYGKNISLKNLHLLNSGSNPIRFEYCYQCNGSELVVSGAWNKGDAGNGYVTFNKTFNSCIRDSAVSDIRHIVFQWSSANNCLQNVATTVDINFHGGYSQNNRATDIEFNLADQHPWPEVYRTPADAEWAPPDGSGNVVTKAVAR